MVARVSTLARGGPSLRARLAALARTRVVSRGDADNCRARGELHLQGNYMELDDITGAAVEEAIRFHRKPGSGLFESVYERLLESALQRRGMRVERQRAIGFTFEGLV